MEAQRGKTHQWRHLVRKIGENLRTDDVENLMYLLDVPGGIQQEINGNGMKMLQYLERVGEINEDNPEKLKTILGEIPRNDLKKHVNQFQNSWKESKKMTGSINMPGLMTPSAFTVTKDGRLQKTDSFEEGHYLMNNKPHGLCVIISNKDFQSGAEIVEKEKGKPAAEDEYSMERDLIQQTQAQSRPGNEVPENFAAQSENFISGSENAPSSAPPHVAAQSETLTTTPDNMSSTSHDLPEQSENLNIATTTLHTTPESEHESSNFTMQPVDEMTEHATATNENLMVSQSTSNDLPEQSENLTTATTTLHSTPEDEQDPSNFIMQPEDEVTEHATATQENLMVSQSTDLSTSTENISNNEDSELNDTGLSLKDTSLEDVTVEMDDSEFNRKGTEVDEKLLQQTFEWLNFKVVPIHNCTGQKMRSELKSISKMDHKKHDAFVCCILSHGYEDGVYGTDWDLLPLTDIRKMFTGEKCKGLLEKPKIFFFQACRGSNIDIGSLKFHKATESEYTGMSSAVPPKDQAVGFDGGHIQDKKEPAKKTEKIVHPNDCDFLFAQAATKGNKALRHVEKGSWFISTVCEVLRKEAHKKDLLHMMTTVKRRISNKTNYDMGRYKCAPESTDNLSKDLRFKVEETWEDYRERNGIGN